MHEYTFDVRLSAVVKVRADTEAEAKVIVENLKADGLNCKLGKATLAEAKVEGPPFLFMVDGGPTAGLREEMEEFAKRQRERI